MPEFELVDGSGISYTGEPIDNETLTHVNALGNGLYTFKEQHYWMPFIDDLISYTSDWEQNPGW